MPPLKTQAKETLRPKPKAFRPVKPTLPASGERFSPERALRTLTRGLRHFDIFTFLGKRQRIGGLVIHEGVVELALLQKTVGVDGEETTTSLFYAKAAFPEESIVEGVLAHPASVTKALATLRAEAKGAGLDSVIVSLPDSIAQFKTLAFPLHLSREQIEEALKLAAETSFPLPQSELYFDWTLPEAGGAGFQKQAVVVSLARRQHVEQYLEVIAQAGFAPVAVETHALSLGRLFVRPEGARVAVFSQPSEVVIVAYLQNFPRVSVELPRTILQELGAPASSIEERVAHVLERVAHSVQSGEEAGLVSEVFLIPNAEERQKLEPLLTKKLGGLSLGDPGALSVPAGDGGARDGWTAVTFGAALRGLIPRKLDTLISLMALGTEAAYERARLAAFVSFLTKTSMGVGGFFVIAFGSVLLLINVLGRNIDEALNESVAVPSEYTTLNEQAVFFNRQTKALATITRHEVRWRVLFETLDRLENVGVAFRRIEIAAGAHAPQAITLGGIARNRDALLQLKATLENSPVFSIDPLPLPLLLEKENIVFTIALRPKNPSDFFP